MTVRIVSFAPAARFIAGPRPGNKSITAFSNRPGPGSTTVSALSLRIAVSTARPTAPAGEVPALGSFRPTPFRGRSPWPAPGVAAGVVDQHIDPAVRTLRRSGHGLELTCVGQIGRNRHRVELLGQGLDLVPRPARQNEPVAGARQIAGDDRPDTT